MRYTECNVVRYPLYNKTGCQWRLLPREFGPWQTVYYYFRKWKFEESLDWINNDTLYSLVRKPIGREESPSMGIIDSRSVKTSHYADPLCKGIDRNKKVKGRKEHIVVDTLGLPMAVAVHEANLHDSKDAPNVIERLEHKFPCLVKILADGGYHGTLGDWVAKKFGWTVEVVLRPDKCPTKFPVLPKRWIVESSFSWLENFKCEIAKPYATERIESSVYVTFLLVILLSDSKSSATLIFLKKMCAKYSSPKENSSLE